MHVLMCHSLHASSATLFTRRVPLSSRVNVPLSSRVMCLCNRHPSFTKSCNKSCKFCSPLFFVRKQAVTYSAQAAALVALSAFLSCLFVGIGQNHTFIGVYGLHTVFLAGKSPYIRSFTVQIYGSGQHYFFSLFTAVTT